MKHTWTIALLLLVIKLSIAIELNLQDETKELGAIILEVRHENGALYDGSLGLQIDNNHFSARKINNEFGKYFYSHLPLGEHTVRIQSRNDNRLEKKVSVYADTTALYKIKLHKYTTGGMNLFIRYSESISHRGHFIDGLFRKKTTSSFPINPKTNSFDILKKRITSRNQKSKRAIIIEELVNYFEYDYPLPKHNNLFKIYSEIGKCPWNADSFIVHIGIKAKNNIPNLDQSKNLVVIVDPYMMSHMPLVRESLRMIARNLDENDKISILLRQRDDRVLPTTSGDKKDIIIYAIGEITGNQNSCTDYSKILDKAYIDIQKSYIQKGENRIIIFSNCGYLQDEQENVHLKDLVSNYSKSNVPVSLISYAPHDANNRKIEFFADQIDADFHSVRNIGEAVELFDNDALFSDILANNVKLEVNFNPHQVQAFRLLSSDKEPLKYAAKLDFESTDIYPGHSVTGLYEIIPVGVDYDKSVYDSLGFQQCSGTFKSWENKDSNDLAEVVFSYRPKNKPLKKSLIENIDSNVTAFEACSDDFRFSVAVAKYGEMMNNINNMTEEDFDFVHDVASRSKGLDYYNKREEFIKLVDETMWLYEYVWYKD